jgi:hypothetical protein
MRKVLAAVATGGLAITLSASAAQAAPPASASPQVRPQSHHVRADDDGDREDDQRSYHHEDHCHGLLTRLLCWLV